MTPYSFQQLNYGDPQSVDILIEIHGEVKDVVGNHDKQTIDHTAVSLPSKKNI